MARLQNRKHCCQLVREKEEGEKRKGWLVEAQDQEGKGATVLHEFCIVLNQIQNSQETAA
jgi:hypothetical protein